MEQHDDGWRESVKDAVKPWRDRLVRGLGGTMPERGLSYDELVRLLYPTLPDELRPALGLLSGDWRRDYRHPHATGRPARTILGLDAPRRAGDRDINHG